MVLSERMEAGKFHSFAFLFAQMKLEKIHPFFANQREESACVGLLVANEAYQADGENWVQLSPFGTFPNQAGKQVFTPADGESIVNEFNSQTGRISSPTGLPFYEGHPDHPAFKAIYTDHTAKGRIKKLDNRHAPNCAECAAFANESAESPCRKHGLFGKIKWNDQGRKLIENEAYHGHSTNWQMHREADGWHPHYLKSVGFTNEPGIPVPAITAANEQENHMAKAKTFMDHVNELLGTSYANEDEASAGMTDFANQAKIHKQAATDLQGKCDSLTATNTGLVNDMAAITKKYGANEAVDAAVAPLFANERPDGVVVLMANELATLRTATARFGDLAAVTTTLTVAGLTLPEKDVLPFLANEVKTVRGALKTNSERERRSIGLLLRNGGFATKAEVDALLVDMANESKSTDAFGRALAMRPKIRVTSHITDLTVADHALRGDQAKQGDNVNKVVTMVNERMDKNKREKTRTNGKTPYDFAYDQIMSENPEIATAMKKPQT